MSQNSTILHVNPQKLTALASELTKNVKEAQKRIYLLQDLISALKICNLSNGDFGTCIQSHDPDSSDNITCYFREIRANGCNVDIIEIGENESHTTLEVNYSLDSREIRTRLSKDASTGKRYTDYLPDEVEYGSTEYKDIILMRIKPLLEVAQDEHERLQHLVQVYSETVIFKTDAHS